MKKILIISPKFPLPTTGACEQDRLSGFLQLKRLGFDVRIVSKYFDWQDRDAIMSWGRERGMVIDLIPYEQKSFFQKLTQFLNPINWDGAAYEYKLPGIQQAVRTAISEFKPDVAWFEYTYLYPLYHIFRERNIPIVTRSINVEPSHFLQEDGVSITNLIKFLPKWYSELHTIRASDYLFAITPNEERQYKKLGAKRVATLPLRSLPRLAKQSRDIRESDVLHLFFMGASYNVHHNRKAAEFIIKEVAPEVEKRAPGKFFFHILGKKLPKDLSVLCVNNIKEEGFVDDLDAFLMNEADAAVIPSIMGAGMQQKIFEPLVYGIPSVVSSRGIAGYLYQDKKHALFADTKDEFVKQILKLQDINLRRQLSKNALALSQDLFSQERLDSIVMEGLHAL
ncbi:MAG: glycosyltransferase family 4 protein [Parcubacteria group bacterium]|nr:glycosyltransferase family 4 protein [Parcubacteria group bacterium]